MIIMSFVEMMVGTAQNIIKLFVAAALYRKLLKVHLIFGHYNTAAWDGITLALCPSVCGSDLDNFFLSFQWVPGSNLPNRSLSSQIFFKLFHDVDNKSESKADFFVWFFSS